MKKVSKVFWITLTLVLAATVFAIISPTTFESATANFQAFITSTFGWYYLIAVTVMVIFCIVLAVTPIGQIRLGKPDERPEYSTGSWFAMLFSAGMGIGLVFWGASEPLLHFASNPPLAEAGSDEALKDSMQYTFFHWGLHAWAIYAVVALALAYFKFRKGEPGLISATLVPLFGERMRGGLGTVVDVLAVFATVVGVATTLGFGAIQINGGLSYLLGIPISFWWQVLIIAVVTVLFLISAWTGISKGIRYLSNTNMVLAVTLMVIMLIIGPTMLILNLFTNSLGSYAQNLLEMSFRIAPLDAENRSWINDWTIFYWAWWISWSPFVGIFIARVSRGRTIREFMAGVLLLPSLVSFFWFSVFGSSSINVQKLGIIDLTGLQTEELLFAVFNEYQLGAILSVVAILLISTFFITSADSATFVLGMQTTYGSLTPSNSVKMTWGLAQSTVAVILLSANGLQALQNALIIAALPFSFVMILMMISTYKSLNQERKDLGLFITPKRKDKKLK
ncbi:glycine betaine uptake BCCT transporter [Jeotgalibacillus proteolyticus]|uniref:Glycine/betaine ABC transporter permease n=1 Tax=Jeotgalibacillus proteolyticus TaxID=2082395 RepID=A0A2S5GGA3_9BACL|nr:BCCT family transporter [Jeotgalibacillus proteolyticus]PPA71951.1 glycine/betaine ABC transporter permease [Jeotgalibacillus proteolyticus]